MKNLFVFFSILIPSLINAQKGNVLYGERDLKSYKLAIYFDRKGIIYPSFFISDSSLQACNASLSEWYSKNENDFLKISKQYKCKFQKYSIENCTILNDSLASAFTYKLNNIKASSQSFTILIHGYRKSFTQKNGDVSSPLAFQFLKESISKFNKSNTNFVEVYWDGMYDCCFSSSSKNNLVLFTMFEEAQVNASFAGNALKKILANIKQDTINIFTHSLGAKVATYSLLNIEGQNSITPSNKKINICFIVPATSSQLFEENYYKRNSKIDFQKNDNYRLLIIYNEKDFALRKKDNKFLLFGPGPYKFGDTSLGCNHKKSAIKLEEAFKNQFKNSTIELFDFTSIGKHHHLENYCASPLFQQLVETIYL